MEYFVIHNDEQRGPFTVEELRTLGLRPDTPVWREGMAYWRAAREEAELQSLLEVPPAPQAPSAADAGYTSRIPPEWHGANVASAASPLGAQPASDPWHAETQGTGQPPTQGAVPHQGGGHRSKQRKSNNGWWIAAAIAAVLLVVMVVTNPDRADHRRAVVSALSDWLDDKVDSKLGSGMLGSLIKMGGGIAFDASVNRMLDVHNYIIFSTGHLDAGVGEPVRVSLGIFGHVFTFNKEQVDEKLLRALNGDDSASIRQEPEPQPEAEQPDEPQAEPQPTPQPNTNDEAANNEVPGVDDEFSLDKTMKELEELTDEKIEQMADSAYKALKEEIKRNL